VARRWKWEEQVKLCALLSRWLPADAFFSAIDNIARDATSGAMRQRRCVVPGLPDCLIVYRGRLIAVELKSPSGKCTSAQREVRKALLRSGCRWFECISARGDGRDRRVRRAISHDYPRGRHSGALEEAAISGLGKTTF